MATEDPTAERWLPVVGFEGSYEVSSLGRVRSIDRIILYGALTRTVRGRLMKPTLNRRSGYLKTIFSSGGRLTFPRVHRLVLSAFVRAAGPGEVCNHKNFNRADNRLVNLEWVTQRENCAHAAAAGRIADVRGERHGSARLTEKAVRDIRSRASCGERKVTLAAEYGVCLSTIYGVCSRRWTHV